mmetsp:Transcript_87617/g.251072  ORF Transcript_87617/g.251072 Transcript_87617/m.251072 type:complete len:247 (+) Transcript_87617:563-1303(+)
MMVNGSFDPHFDFSRSTTRCKSVARTQMPAKPPHKMTAFVSTASGMMTSFKNLQILASASKASLPSFQAGQGRVMPMHGPSNGVRSSVMILLQSTPPQDGNMLMKSFGRGISKTSINFMTDLRDLLMSVACAFERNRSLRTPPLPSSRCSTMLNILLALIDIRSSVFCSFAASSLSSSSGSALPKLTVPLLLIDRLIETLLLGRPGDPDFERPSVFFAKACAASFAVSVARPMVVVASSRASSRAA